VFECGNINKLLVNVVGRTSDMKTRVVKAFSLNKRKPVYLKEIKAYTGI